MKFAAMVTRTLKLGKTYEDYRKVWYHTVGFGVPTMMYTVVSAQNPREIISIGLFDVESFQKLQEEFQIDVKERKAHPMDEVVESTMVRQFGLVIAVDDFSKEGELSYVPPKVNGEETNLDDIPLMLSKLASNLVAANQERETHDNTSAPAPRQ